MTPGPALPPETMIASLGRRWFFARARAVSGEWTLDGHVVRLAVLPARWPATWARGLHLIVGPWCLSLGTFAR